MAEGTQTFDGVWAPHWYNAVWNSTGFARETAAASRNCRLNLQQSPTWRGPITMKR